MLAISSAFVFAAQMINFPIFYGASRHLVGGTFLTVILGQYTPILSMTIVLMMQALFKAERWIIHIWRKYLQHGNYRRIKLLCSQVFNTTVQQQHQIFLKCLRRFMAFHGVRSSGLWFTDRLFAHINRRWRRICYSSGNTVLARTDWFW